MDGQQQPRYVQMTDGTYVEWPQSVSPEDFKAQTAGKFGNPSLDNRNGLQKVFDEGTKPLAPEERTGVPNWMNEASDLGTGFIHGVGSLAMHPIESAKGLVHAFTSPRETANEIIQAGTEHPGYTLGETIGGLVGAGGAAGTVDRLPSLARSIPKVTAERFTGSYKSPVIPEELQNASTMAKAIKPVHGVAPGFEDAIAKQMPRIRAFGEETGNPMHSGQEGSVAARGLAEKGLEHYNTKLLDPYGNEQISMSSVPGYGGRVTGEGKFTTLRDLNDRITKINQEQAKLRAAGKTGADVTASLLRLDNEEGPLRQILYRELSKRTGIDESAIRDFRQSYGQQFNIADELDAARRARLGYTENPSRLPLSKYGMADKMLDLVRGAPEFRANRSFRNALQKFEPVPMEYPEPMAKIVRK